MKRQFAKLDRIDNNETVTYDRHDDFLFNLRRAVLITLLEQGRLLPMEYRYAEEKMKQQQLCRARKLLEKGEHE